MSAPRLRDYLSYGVGMTGNQIMRDVPTALLLFYMTNALLIPPAYAGFAILLPKIWVIVADPVVGMLSDRTRGRWGARKPFLFVGAVVSFVAFVMLFNVAVPSSPLLATCVVGLLYLLVATGYSIYSVPYLTLAAEIGRESRERTRALSYKQYFCLVGVLAGLSFAPWLIERLGGDKSAYGTMAWVVGAIMLVTTLATAVLVPVRQPLAASPRIEGHMLAQVRDAFRHRPFRIVFVAALLQLIGFGVTQGGGLYFLIYTMRLSMDVMGVSILASVAGSGLAQILWVRLANRAGPVRAYRVASFYAAVVAGAVLLVPTGNVWAYVVYGFVSGTASSGYTLLSFASLVEAIALDGPDSPRKGLFAAAYTAMEKATLAIGGFLVAMALSFAEFQQGAPAADQPQSALLAIPVVYVGVPAVLKLISGLVLGRYFATPATSPMEPAASHEPPICPAT